MRGGDKLLQSAINTLSVGGCIRQDFKAVFGSLEENRRRKNEEKFGSWQDLPDGGRVYFYEVQGHHGWTARYPPWLHK